MLSAIGEIVKAHDYDRFLTGLFAPPDKRDALYTLYAFNYEIARTREMVSETTMGLIRLTWWREAIDEIYDGKPPRPHEVVTPLAAVIKTYDLPKHYFETLIYAREFDLEDVLPADLKGLKNYTEFTNAPLLSLAALVLKSDAAEDNMKAAAQVVGLTGLLRAAPYHLQQRRCYFPTDMLDEAGLDLETLYAGKGRDTLKSVTCDIVWAAEEAFKDVKPDKVLRPVLLQASLAKQYLRYLKRHDYDIFSGAFQQRPPFSVLRLLMNYYLNRI